MVHTGEMPSEKDTGELEPILPEWLQDARQQSRESADDDSFGPETRPKVQSAEPIDLLAGLASQDDSEEDEVPDWLASISPVEDEKSGQPSTSDEKEEPPDFFAQFSQTEPQPSTPSADEPAQTGESAFMGGIEPQGSGQADELADWLSQTDKPAVSEQGDSISEDNSWMRDLGEPESAERGTPVEKEPEDLSWLHDLENASKQTGDLSSSQDDSGFDPAATQLESSGEDLSWLDTLGGTSASASKESTPAQSESSQEDLSWLNNLGGTQATSSEEPESAQPETSQDDLSWLNNLGGAQPSTEESETVQPESSREDLEWLKDIGGAPVSASDEPVPAEPESSQDDFSWMKNLGEEQSAAPSELGSTGFTPPGTAPLDENVARDSTPDWLKSAMEEPTMPAPGDLSMDWFAGHGKSSEAEIESESQQQMPEFQIDEPSASFQDEPASIASSTDSPSSDSFPSTSQDLDDMFNVEMPDWISQDSGTTETSQSESAGSLASEDDTLSPVELPSWVQAMRPVDSAIADSSVVDDSEQVIENEGPLAGFRGVIPSAPIGSSLRPKAFSMKLQVSHEQQAGASLMEKIIAGETASHSVKLTPTVASQRMLRWMLSGLFIIVLGLVIGVGSQSFGIVAPGQVSQLSNLILTIPEGSPVLLVVDYEPAVVGELTAAAGPVLDQLALTRHSTFTFLSMSPSGSALAEYLMSNTNINRPISEGGIGYQSGIEYFNAGFLPGGSAGVFGFIDDPVEIMPGVMALVGVDTFSNFEAIVLMTDNADSGREWVEQLEFAKQTHPEMAPKPLILVSSAQSGPLFEPYVSSGQVAVMVNGLSDAAKYEYVNQSRPGNARKYWDSFGVGLMIAVLSIMLGSIWNVLIGIRERRAEAELG